MLPFTRDQFLGVFAACNTATRPAEIVAYVVGAVALATAFSGRAGSGRPVAALLALLWLWTGAVYHWTCFAAINPAARAFAIAFIAQGVLLLWVGTIRDRLAYAAPPGSPRRLAGLALAAYAAMAYPLTSWAAGHTWPARPAFGTTPCPLVIFTLGVLLLSHGRVPWVLLAIPIAWAAIGGSAAVLLDMPQDLALPLAAIAAVVLLRHDARSIERKKNVLF